jgi:hypothetical protein
VDCRALFLWRFDSLVYLRSVASLPNITSSRSFAITFILVFLAAHYFTIAYTFFYDFHSLLLSLYAACCNSLSVPSFTRIYLTPNSRPQTYSICIIHPRSRFNHPASQSRETKKKKNRAVYVTTHKFQFHLPLFARFMLLCSNIFPSPPSPPLLFFYSSFFYYYFLVNRH